MNEKITADEITGGITTSKITVGSITASDIFSATIFEEPLYLGEDYEVYGDNEENLLCYYRGKLIDKNALPDHIKEKVLLELL